MPFFLWWQKACSFFQMKFWVPPYCYTIIYTRFLSLALAFPFFFLMKVRFLIQNQHHQKGKWFFYQSTCGLPLMKQDQCLASSSYSSSLSSLYHFFSSKFGKTHLGLCVLSWIWGERHELADVLWEISIEIAWFRFWEMKI